MDEKNIDSFYIINRNRKLNYDTDNISREVERKKKLWYPSIISIMIVVFYIWLDLENGIFLSIFLWQAWCFEFYLDATVHFSCITRYYLS